MSLTTACGQHWCGDNGADGRAGEVEYCVDMSRHVLERHGTCPRHRWDMSLKDVGHVRHRWDMSQTQVGHVPDTGGTCPRHRWDMSQTQVGHVPDTGGTCPSFHLQYKQNICYKKLQGVQDGTGCRSGPRYTTGGGGGIECMRMSLLFQALHKAITYQACDH